MITFPQQPSGNIGANSPLIYQAQEGNSTLYNSAGFYYSYKIYVWTGTNTIPATPIATITKFPDVYAGMSSYIDIHRIASEYISMNQFTIGVNQPTIGNGAYWVYVYVETFNTANPTIPQTVLGSNICLATRGYSYSIENINKNWTTPYLSNRTSILLNTDTTLDYIWYDATQVTKVVIGAISYFPTSGSTSDKKIQGLNIVYGITNAGLWGTDCTITLKISGGDVIIPVTFECPNKYGNTTTLYMNRYGVWEGFSWNGVSVPTVNISKDNYQTALFTSATMTTAWLYGMRQSRLLNIQSKKVLQINSNWIPESMVELVTQFISSEGILIIDGTNYYAANPTDMSMEIKKATNVKLIMYTMNLEYAQPLINKIVR